VLGTAFDHLFVTAEIMLPFADFALRLHRDEDRSCENETGTSSHEDE
jgi:hypothetical protein